MNSCFVLNLVPISLLKPWREYIYFHYSLIFTIHSISLQQTIICGCLLAPHGAQAVIAFRYYPSLPFPPLPYYYIFQTFSSNLSVPSTRGGISSDLCSSNSLGTSYSRHESESEWPAGLVYLDCTVLYYWIFSKYSPQTSQNQCLEEASIGLCVGATP